MYDKAFLEKLDYSMLDLLSCTVDHIRTLLLIQLDLEAIKYIRDLTRVKSLMKSFFNTKTKFFIKMIKAIGYLINRKSIRIISVSCCLFFSMMLSKGLY